MNKHKVIIADADKVYLAALVKYIAENYYDNIELEIITDSSYLMSYFSSTPRAELMIVSEPFHKLNLNYDGISNVFVLQESSDECEGENIRTLDKYSSLKELFIEITSVCGWVFGTRTGDLNNPKIILVTSGSGGTGKTFISLALSRALAVNKRVLYLDAESLQTFQCYLTDTSPLTDEICNRCNHIDENIYNDIRYSFKAEGFTYFPRFKSPLYSQGINESIFAEIARGAKKSGDFDFIIIDSDSLLNGTKAQLCQLADKIMVITDQAKKSVYATSVLLSSISGSMSEKTIVICNNYSDQKDTVMLGGFNVEEYADHFDNIDTMSMEEIAASKCIKRISYLVF